MTSAADVNFDFYDQEQIQARKLWKKTVKRGSIVQLMGQIMRTIIQVDLS